MHLTICARHRCKLKVLRTSTPVCMDLHTIDSNNSFAKTFCCKQTAMNAAVDIENAPRNHSRNIEKYFRRAALVTNIDNVHNDSAYLVWIGPKSSLKFYESYLFESTGGSLEHQDGKMNAELVMLFSKYPNQLRFECSFDFFVFTLRIIKKSCHHWVIKCFSFHHLHMRL